MTGIASILRGGTAAAARKTLDAVYAHTPPAIVKFNDLVVASGEGCWVTTTDGRRLLDMSSGIGAVSTGHCHPAVVEAVRAQAGRVVHAQQNVFGAHTAMVDLYDRLATVLPPSLDQYFLANSGAEAVDNAVKIARAATGRPNVIAFEGGFHGRTLGAMALTSSKTIYRQGFGPTLPGVHIAPYPYCLHCKVQTATGHAGYPPVTGPQRGREVACCGGPLESLERLLATQSAPSDTAAVILEPILGEGGFVAPPPGFLAGLRALCDRHGILMIADEVQTGAARTGLWWGHQHWLPAPSSPSSPSSAAPASSPGHGGGPDLLVFAKGIASGYPLAGVATRRELVPASKMPPGTLGGTYGANAVCCAAATATIDVINQERLADNAAARGTQLREGLAALAAELPPGLIADVRGRGLMVGVEFGGATPPRAEGGGGGARFSTPTKGVASAITRACAASGMLLLTAGAREAVRFLPPLTISAAEVDMALGLFRHAAREVLRA